MMHIPERIELSRYLACACMGDQGPHEILVRGWGVQYDFIGAP